MKYYAAFSDKGEILRREYVPYNYIECDEDTSDATHYIDVAENRICKKASLQFDKQVSRLSVTLSGLPSGLLVSTNGMEIITDNDPLVINYDVPGIYTIWLSGHFKYLDYSLEVSIGNP